MSACLIAALSAVVAAYGLLPVYRIQARFLVLYSPFACLLVLAYLTYIRDWLVRLMFARFLQRSSEPYNHFRHQPFYKSWQPFMERAGRRFLALAPGLLICVSFYSMSRYATRMNESIDLASGMYAERLSQGGEIETASLPPDSMVSSEGRASATTTDSASRSLEPDELQAYLLREAAIDDIPYFGELTVLYITGFAAAAVALLLMALKEYGRALLGISDQELVLGRPQGDDA